MDVFRDAIWQFIGAVIGVLAIFASIYIFLRQRSKKSLAYEVITQTELLSIKDEIKGKVQVLFEGQAVQNVHLISMQIFNDGNVSIRASDFERPIRFSFGNRAIVLSADITDVKPKTLKPIMSTESNCIVIDPLLVNSGDAIYITLLLTQHDGTIKLDTRIEGVHEIKSGSRTTAIPWTRGLAVIGLFGAVLYLLYLLMPFALAAFLGEVPGSFLSISLVIGVVIPLLWVLLAKIFQEEISAFTEYMNNFGTLLRKQIRQWLGLKIRE